jgi:hypothetical protein
MDVQTLILNHFLLLLRHRVESGFIVERIWPVLSLHLVKRFSLLLLAQKWKHRQPVTLLEWEEHAKSHSSVRREDVVEIPEEDEEPNAGARNATYKVRDWLRMNHVFCSFANDCKTIVVIIVG